MSFNQPPGNANLQFGGGGDAPKQALPSFGAAKPTFGVASGAAPTGGFGGSSGFSFAGAVPGQGTAFNLSTPASAPQQGFSFGTAANTTGAPTAFGGIPSAAAAAPAPSFGAAGIAPGAAPAFGAAAATTMQAKPGLFGSSAFTPGAAPTFGTTSTGAAPSFGVAVSAPGATPSFGAVASNAPGTVPSFGAVAASAPGAAPSFGTAPASQALSTAPSMGFSLGSTAISSAAGTVTGFSLGGSMPPAASGSFSLGGATSISITPATASTPPTGGFAPLPVASSAPAATGFSFGGATTAPASSGLSLGVTSTAPATAGFSLGTTAPTTSSTGFSLATPGVAASTAPPAATAAAPSVSFNFPASSAATTSAAPQLSFNLGSTTVSTSITSATTTATTDTTQSGPVTSLNFVQLEETINKWTMDLEEQEKLFMLQATQVNAWDRTLTSNGEKIESLNRAVESIKMEQQRLDNELDFICSQQRELEDCLVPLEKELAGNAVTDPEREHTYELAANMDTQLKQMSEDLKEIIENLNERNRAQDSSDPLVQIGRILNSHMDSLQWIEHNTHAVQTHLDQVSKLHESHRRDNERSFHLTYD